MRVAFITDTFHPMVDGITKATTALGEGLREEGNEVRYWACTTRKGAEYPGATYYRGIPFYSYPEYGINLFARGFEESLMGFKPDVVHVHSPGGLGLQAVHIAKRKDIPCVFTYHTNLLGQMHYLPLHGIMGGAYKIAIMKAIGHFSGKSSATITPSEHGKEMLLEMGIGSEIIPNAVDTSRFRKKGGSGFLREKVGTENIVLVAGRIIKEKNLDSVLGAAAQMGDEAAFAFVGSGPYENSLRKKAGSMGLLGKNVFFLGRVGDAELVECYSGASLLFFPSTYDTFGLVCVEAMLCGLPVVAPEGSAQAGIEGIVEYAPGKEVESIRAALREKKGVPEGIVEGIRKRFGKRQVAKDHVEAYRKIMR